MPSILVFADLHLGCPGAPGLEWALDMLSKASHRASACVCLGDIIDRAADPGRYLPQAYAVMERACEFFAEVHFISGNHDVHHELQLPEAVRVHSTEVHSFECAGATVLTAAVATDPDPRELTFPPRTADGTLIGLLHSSVTGEYSKGTCLPLTPQTLSATGADAWVLGHVHTPEVLSQDPFIGWVGMGKAVLVDVPSATITRL